MAVRALSGHIISLCNWNGFAIACADLNSTSSFRELLEGKLQLYLLYEYEGETQKKLYVGETQGRVVRPWEGRRFVTRDLISPRSLLFFSHSPFDDRRILRYMEGRIYFALRRASGLRFVNTSIPLSSRQALSSEEVEASEAYLSGVWKTLAQLDLVNSYFLEKWAQSSHRYYEMRVEQEGTERFADAEWVDSKLIVKKGSPALLPQIPRLDDHHHTRKNLIIQGILKFRSSGTLVFSRDFVFSSPYAAACVVNGANSSPQRWVGRGTGHPLGWGK